MAFLQFILIIFHFHFVFPQNLTANALTFFCEFLSGLTGSIFSLLAPASFALILLYKYLKVHFCGFSVIFFRSSNCCGFPPVFSLAFTFHKQEEENARSRRLIK